MNGRDPYPFQESSLFPELFERIVQQYINVGLLVGVDLSLDSTQIRADASPDCTITHEQLPEVAKVNRTVREYIERVERENVTAEPAETPDPSGSEAEVTPELRRRYRNSPPIKVSTTDPEAASVAGSAGQREDKISRLLIRVHLR